MPDPDLRPAVLVGEGPRDVIVTLEADKVHARAAALRARRKLTHDDPSIRSYKRRAYQSLQRDFEGRLARLGLKGGHRFENVPAIVVALDHDEQLQRIEALSGVESVHENLTFTPSLAASLPVIGQPAAALARAVGRGTAVAVLDSGVDFTHSDFGACAAAGTPGCRVALAADFALPDGSLDDSGHGSNVAGIVAGVAPGARILSLDVFDQVPLLGPVANVIGIAKAIDFVVATKFTFNTVAMNLSLGIDGVGSRGRCATPIDPFFLEAQAVGVMPIVASGNDSDPERVSVPACSPHAVAVGRTNNDDVVAASSNSSRALDLLAPGTNITAGGFTLSGTSMAAPHVAGAWAVMRAARADLDDGQVLQALKDTGIAVTDARQNRVTPRIQLDAALGWVAQTIAPPWLLNYSDLGFLESQWADCQVQEVADGLVCGWQTVTDVVTDALECGVTTVTNGAVCGYDTVTSAAACGYTTVTSAAQCGYDTITGTAADLLGGDLPCECNGFSCTCQSPAQCQVAAQCEVPASCSVDATCTIERNCDPETEICDPNTCAVEICGI